ncbi:MAG TPA: NAD(P)(+) transhydrogenase (Re/Si-specific) subunit beta [Alphaproteobacteria bacterium]|nr:NAD(P)(+) transhydrogenase (Re/Si-specific) subunit beta [Alphaproteobacteria bacterium]
MLSFGSDAVLLAGLAAAVLFILGLKGLASPKTARRGNQFAMAGMAIAVVTLLFSHNVVGAWWMLPVIAIGAAIGIPLATRTPLTALPQLVAAFHSFVGLAAGLVSIGTYLNHGAEPMEVHTSIELVAGAAIGLITFSGSILAALKLQGVVSGKPWAWKGRHFLNLGLVILIILCGIQFCITGSAFPFGVIVLASTILGYTLVAPIGGADMPVIVSMLNSYSGWAASASGFLLGLPLLIITGALIGASGAILSYIMCAAMNRSFISVIAGGFGSDAGSGAPELATGGTVKTAGVEDAAFMLANAGKVIIIPGYGMAVAQAQHALKEVFNLLLEKGVQVDFAIHPVAGRMPGHMNVLLAEADIPYEHVHELEEINPAFPQTDVVLVIGANDVVNPAAQNSPGSPIYGMPILEAYKSKLVYVIKRSLNPGYAGVDNPLFAMDNTALLLGDAKDVCEKLAAAVKLG